MKLKSPARLAALILFSGCLNAAALADGIQKLGYVNPIRIYTEPKSAQKIETALQKEFGERQRRIADLQQQGLGLQQQLAGGKLSGAQKQKTEEALLDLISRYRRESAELAEEYNLRRNEEFLGLQNRANAIIKDIARRERYDLIIQEAVFVSGKYDITDRVIKALDAQSK